MKNILIFAAIAVLLFSACSSISGRKFRNLTDFKKVIENESLDSSSHQKDQSVDYYNFYLKSYKISITVNELVPFNSKKEMSIYTTDFYGKLDLDFCSDFQWSYDQQQEILQLLLIKEAGLKN